MTFPDSSAPLRTTTSSGPRLQAPGLQNQLPAHLPEFRHAGLLHLFTGGSVAQAGRARRPHRPALPDGAMLGLERDGNLYAYDFASKHETQLTPMRRSTCSTALRLGVRGEFGQGQAWNWSPDSRHLAYWQVDERAEPVCSSRLRGLHQDWTKIRIPQPGDSNPTVRIGVVDVKSGAGRGSIPASPVTTTCPVSIGPAGPTRWPC